MGHVCGENDELPSPRPLRASKYLWHNHDKVGSRLSERVCINCHVMVRPDPLSFAMGVVAFFDGGGGQSLVRGTPRWLQSSGFFELVFRSRARSARSRSEREPDSVRTRLLRSASVSPELWWCGLVWCGVVRACAACGACVWCVCALHACGVCVWCMRVVRACGASASASTSASALGAVEFSSVEWSGVEQSGEEWGGVEWSGVE